MKLRCLFSAACLLGACGTTALAQPAPGSVSPDVGFTLENSLSLRDPFSRYVIKTEDGRDENTIPELERFELERFKLVGVITGSKKNKALLTAPDGKMHVVSESMSIGTRRGIVKRITPDAIVVHEKVVNLLGQEEGVDSQIEFKEK